jgi:hypothetical protein
MFISSSGTERSAPAATRTVIIGNHTVTKLHVRAQLTKEMFLCQAREALANTNIAVLFSNHVRLSAAQ